MEKLTIRYSKRQHRIWGLQALAWSILAILYFAGEKVTWTDYGFGILAIAYIGAFLWYRFLPYATLESGTLTEHGFRKKKVDLGQLDTLKTFAGDLVLKSPEQKIKLNLGIIRPEDKEKLMTALDAFAPEHLQGRAV